MCRLLGIEKYMAKVISLLGNREDLGSPFFIMKYALGHAFSARNLFENFPVRKLKMSVDQCKDIYSDGNKRDLAVSIFLESLEMVVNDIVDNNVHFKFPGLGKTQAYLYMKRTSGDKFKKAFKKGKWKDVDFITSNFSGYQLALRMESEKRLPREKAVYLSSKDKQKITDNTNSGKQY